MKNPFPQAQRANVNGISLAYYEWPGEKGPLICLPSITGQKGSFGPLGEGLAPHYRVLALDLRGRGDSDKPREGYGFAYHARDIFAFADALGLESFSLLGHSFGATTGAYAASLQPERIKALVLMDGGAEPKPEILRSMYPMVRRLEKVYPSMDEYVAAQRSVPYLTPWSSSLEQILRNEVETLSDGSVRSKSSAAAIEHDLDVHFWYVVAHNLPGIQSPVLFLRPETGLMGETGHVYSRREAEKLVARFPTGELVGVKGGNHYTMLLQDNPPALPFITEFLQRVLG